MKRLQFGDIVEIKTSKGLAYAIYTHRHVKPPKYGAVIHVFDRLYDSRPTEIAEIAGNPIRFATFFPLHAAVNRKLVEVVGNVPVPDDLKPFPIFRSGNRDSKTKKVKTWWLEDLERDKSWKVGTLTPEQRRLPILSMWNDTYLIHRIQEGWRPENDFRSL
jgi:hypothetical protein